MKIISVSLKNINSLRFEKPVTISFEESPFVESGLFAIIGATGSGKTTILDAMTIALYHSAPRFPEASSRLEKMVSYNAPDASAEVIFESKGQRYRAFWSMVLFSRNKWLAKPKESTQIAVLDKSGDEVKILETKKRSVKEKIIELTGLNYEQFLKSVMLAQGDFAAFINASPTERGKLLEQMTGTSVFKAIVDKTQERLKEETQRKEKISVKMEGVELLKPDQLKVYKNELKVLENRLKLIGKQLEDENRKKQWQESIQKTEIDLQAREGNYKTLLVRQEQLAGDFEMLKRHQQSQPFHGTLESLDDLKQQLDLQLSALKKLEAETDFITREVVQMQTEQDKALVIFEHAKKEQKEWKPVLDEVRKLDQELTVLRKNYQSVKTEKETYAKEKAELSEWLDKKKEDYIKDEKVLEKAIQYLSENEYIADLTENLTAIKQQLELLRKKENSAAEQEHRIGQLHFSANMFQDSLQKAEAEKQHSEKTLLEIEKQRKLLTEKKEDIGITDLRKQYDVLTRKSEQLRGLLRLSKEITDAISFLEVYKKDYITHSQKIVMLEKQLAKQEMDKKVLEADLKVAEELHKKDVLIADLSSHRHKLKEGEECPLCGAKEHPMADYDAEKAVSKTEEKVEEFKQKIKELEREMLQNSRQLSEAKGGKESRGKQLEDIKQELAQVQQEFKGKVGTEGWKPEETQKISQALTDTEQEKQSLAEKMEMVEVIEQKLEQVKILEDKQKRMLYEQDTKKVKFKTDLQHQQKLIEEKKTELSKNREEAVTITQQLNAKLSGYKMQLPEAKHFGEFVKVLEADVLNFKKQKETAQDIKERLLIADKEIESKAKELSHTLKQFDLSVRLSDELEKEGKALQHKRVEKLSKGIKPEEKELVLSEQLAKVEKEWKSVQERCAIVVQRQERHKGQIENCQKNITTLNKNAEQKQAQLLKELKSIGIKQIDVLREWILPLSIKENIEKSKANMDKSLQTEQGEINALKRTQEQLKAQKLTEKTIEQIVESQEEIKAEQQTVIKERANIETLIEKDKSLQKTMGGLQLDFDKQEKEYQRWKQLSDLLCSKTEGGRSQDAFNNFAQGLTLSFLIAQANIRLQKLNPRYSIRKKPETDLDFEVIDHYQADNNRGVSTLSGGEKFLVSLSLALGLSDLASRNVQIDSLFVDEGFGTLDPETLDTVITALENLQASGKMIGVISHVQELKERLTTQIQLKKQSNGFSKIQVVPEVV